MDLERFEPLAAVAYRNADTPYTLEEALSVFRYFFRRFEDTQGTPHPPLKVTQIQRILEIMPYIERKSGRRTSMAADCYPALIDAYFNTTFKNCNYRINHFFSGRIRELRYLESVI